MEEKERNSILFIGNGFDIRYGRKTKYNYFLESREDLYLYFAKKIKESYNKNLKIKYNKEMDMPGNIFKPEINDKKIEDILEKLQKYIYQENPNYIVDSAFLEDNNILILSINWSEFVVFQDYLYLLDSLYLNNLPSNIIEQTKELLDDSLKFLNKDIFEKVENNSKEEQDFNYWIAYFQMNKDKENNNMGENWLDLENIIKDNFTNKDIIKFDDFFLKYILKDGNKEFTEKEFIDFKKTQFLNFKKALTKYLKTQNKELDLDETDENILDEYSELVSFNYTDIHEKFNSKISYVHGKIEDNENIVLGFDEGKAFLDSNEILTDEAIFYTKVDQVIELNGIRTDDIPKCFGKKYDKLGVYGLSMGEADYSYYSNIILNNLEEIEIEIYYYDNEEGSNKRELRNAFYNLIKYIEKLSGKLIYHDMINTGRVKFIKQSNLKN